MTPQSYLLMQCRDALRESNVKVVHLAVQCVDYNWIRRIESSLL